MQADKPSPILQAWTWRCPYLIRQNPDPPALAKPLAVPIAVTPFELLRKLRLYTQGRLLPQTSPAHSPANTPGILPERLTAQKRGPNPRARRLLNANIRRF